MISADGSAAICARVESPKRAGEAGWLHRLREDHFRPEWVRTRTIPLTRTGPRNDFGSLAAEFRNAVDPDRLTALAATLGLSVAALEALDIGWSAAHRGWSFPMRDATGRVLGVRLRGSDGRKFAVTGGKDGLFLPAGEWAGTPLIVCEGASDTAALWDMGFRNLAGRPSCTGGVNLLVVLVRKHKPPHVVILADGDEPGQRGARTLASVLLAYAPCVSTVTPPAGVKDAREWLCAGGTRSDVQNAIDAGSVRRLTIRTTDEPQGR